MERIKQALERARLERGEAPSPGMPPAGMPLSGAGTARRAPAGAEPVKVTYTETWLWDKSGHFQLDTLTEGQL